ncbi:MAG: endonuclease/exonuclease/phosphatase family protein [Planctomycetota bacterium]
MHLRILTYNIHRAIGLDRRFRPERIVEVLKHHDADIVLMQEVDEGAPRSRELDLAREIAEAAGYPHRAVGHNVSLRKGRYGNATLSRHPIERERNIDLTIGRRKRRGCQHTTITLEKQAGHPHTLEVFNLHLGLSAAEREFQVGRLVHSGEFRGLEEGTACIVGGDFNDWRSLIVPIFTRVLGFGNAANLAGQSRDMKTWPSFSPSGSLDKLYYRGGLRLLKARRCRLAVSKVASDHLPIVAEFDLSS